MKTYLDQLLHLSNELSTLLHQMSDDEAIHPAAMDAFSRDGTAGMDAIRAMATLAWCIGTGMPMHLHMNRCGLEIEPKTYQKDYNGDF